MADTYLAPDDDTRALARRLTGAPDGALATVLDGRPLATRVGCAWGGAVGMTLLVSDLSDHARALRQIPAASLLLGAPGGRGDALTQPRLTLRGPVVELDKAAWRDRFLAARPKSTLYYDFADFRLMALQIDEALLNAGFGRAVRLTAADLGT
ncbi:pyridoxamine 5'-phosphate oxidase family protein [Jannaschia ovalis]|uniref:Pyridoxamine 5'-phosphate oxidase family protein n=1 Tax=Jannaschia ovalis TaxID=3038773 RepID=A0ABY8LI27_9RHOB|nr:pyridoxamine 5'-phosphate oxidase family protein [Jannaschia sp. GRR-S6-38]WGH80043.1 pyridoxamine 5'-phosphate oxidase family protein [Jannaschia sp. GRR-S6-38]